MVRKLHLRSSCRELKDPHLHEAPGKDPEAKQDDYPDVRLPRSAPSGQTRLKDLRVHVCSEGCFGVAWTAVVSERFAKKQ